MVRNKLSMKYVGKFVKHRWRYEKIIFLIEIK